MKNFYRSVLSLLIVFQVFALETSGETIKIENTVVTVAQAASSLTGNYTIGAQGDYATLTSAINDIQTEGVSGPVKFSILSGTYSEQVIIPAIAGSSETNTVTFESASGNADNVIISFKSTAQANNYVIRFDNATNIVLRNLTVRALGTTYARTLHGQNRVENLLIEGCNLISRIASVANNSRGNILLEPSVSRDIQFIDNTITGGATGIFYNGTSNSEARAFGTVLRGNTLIDSQGGVFLKYHSGAIIQNNDIKLLVTGSTTGSVGALLDEIDGALRFVNNRIIDARGSGVLMRYCDATSEAPGLVANNFIMRTGNGSGNYSYSMINNAFQRIFHNNMNNTGGDASFYYKGLSSAGNVVKNNIFKSNWSYAVDVSDVTGLDEMDYNNFFTSGVNMAKWGNTLAPDLTTWTTISGKDANSLNEDPLFISDEDLTPQNQSLAEAGFDLTTIVQKDLNGNQRTVPVSMGAIEFGTNNPCAGIICPPGFTCFNGSCFAEIYTVTGIVRDAVTNAPLSGVNVSSTSSGDPASITDANGSYTIEVTYEGVINFTKFGYDNFSSAPILDTTSGLDVLLALDSSCGVTCPPGKACYQGQCIDVSFEVSGTVRDAVTNAPLSGVNVSSTSSGDPASITDANGSYTIEVTYEGVINFTKFGYDTFSSAPILDTTSGLDVLLALDSSCGVTCPPGKACYQGQCIDVSFDVSGTVRDAVTNAPISGVKVFTTSGNPSTFTDASGNYTISVFYDDVINFIKFSYNSFTTAPIFDFTSGLNVLLSADFLCDGVYCALGTICYQGTCYQACQVDNDCPVGTKCFGDICLPLESVVVSGVVRDKDSNLPLANVFVNTIFYPIVETYSDENGYFELTLLERDVVYFSLKDYDGFSFSAISIGQPPLEIYLQYNPKDPCDGVYCALGTSCVNGECIALCQADWDCPEGTFCLGGNCLTLEQLCWATNCPEGTTCLNGRCISDDDPCVNSNCPEGTYCLNGNCVIVNDPSITISGVIKDVVTGAKLSGVLVDAGYKQVLSKTDGSYSIKIPFGFGLNFSRWDYVDFTSSPMSVSRSNYNIELYKNWCLIHDCQAGQVCVNGRCETIFYTVSGVVRDESTNLPIANATVKTPGAQTETDGSGAYIIQVILNNTLLFDKEGYATYQSSNFQTDNGAFNVLLGSDPCAGISCPTGFVCENGVCVSDPCAATVCQPGEYCFNGDCLPKLDLTIMGTVRDINTGEPIAASATVNGIPTLVDYNGYFIVQVPYGDRILFIANGYRSEYSSFLSEDNAVLQIFMTPDADCADIFCPDGKICRDGLCVDPCIDVVCPPGETCVGGQCFQIACESSFTALQVSPTIGTSETEYTFTITYTDPANTNLAVGYPRLELDSNNNGSVEDPGDLVFAMTEIDPSDLDLTDGKIYQVTASGLKDNTLWKARVVAQNVINCSATTAYIDEPNVSVSNLDVAIFANNISFSNDNPNNNEVITIFARVRNISNFPAENFVVSAYDGETQIFTNIIVNLAPKSHIDLSWQYSFAEAGFYPIKVVIDETNVLEEINKLNNFAIRPVIVGNYVLPGGIQATAISNTTTTYAGSWVNISGYASYFGIDEGVNPDVAGANVSFSYENGSFQIITNSNGTFSRSVQMPTTPGVYTFTGSVTDYTLTGKTPSFQIEVIAQPAKADLVTNITLDQTEVLEGEKITGIAMVTNIGELTATNFTLRYSSCEGMIGEVPINSLAPGDTLSFNFDVGITKELGSCFAKNNCSFTALADVYNEVDDKVRNNNLNRKSLTVYPILPDLTPSLSSIASSSRMEEPFLFTVYVNNIGGGNVDDEFVVNVYVDDELLDSKSFKKLPRCEQVAYQLSVDFETKDDHVIRIKVDEPLGSGSIEEYLENNNEFVRMVTYIPPPVLLPNLYITNTSLSVEPGLPSENENFLIKAKVKNTGQVPITEKFGVNFQIAENGVLRNESIVVPTGLANGAEVLVEYETSLASYGNHSVLVELDPLDKIDEASEFDNKASMPLCLDFAAGQAGSVWNGGFFVNTPQYLTGTVRNIGLFTATNVQVDFILNGSEIGSTIIPELKPSYGGAGQNVSIPYTFRETGIFQLEMVIDRDNVFAECDEKNNSIVKSIVVKTPQPDLRILSEYISPSSLNPKMDEEINLFVSFENIGASTLSPFKIRVTVDDIPLGEDILVEGLKAGQLSTVPVETPYSSSTAGVKVVRGFVDIDKDTDDANYMNNDASRSIVVGAAPNLFFTQIRFSNNCPQVGEQIQISVDIENEGDIASNAEVHFYYVTDNHTVPIDFVPIFVDQHGAVTTNINWTVVNTEYRIYAEIKNSDPVEFNDLDNTIWGEYKDTTSPTVNIKNIAVYLDENGLAEIEPSQVDNGSYDDCGIAKMTLGRTSFGCADIGEQTLTFTVKDFAGNETTAEVIVLVADNLPPTIEAPPTITIPEEAGVCEAIEVDLAVPNTADNCSVVSVTNDAPAIYLLGTTTVTWTVTDAAGNTSQQTQQVVVEQGLTAWYIDLDGDGFGDAKSDPVFACSAPENYVDNNLDLDDTDPLINVEVTAIAEVINGVELKMWPNPTSGNVYFDIKNHNSESVKITVLNIIGAKVLEKEFQASDKIIVFDMSQHISGIYLIKIEAGAFKIVKRLIHQQN